MSSRKLTIKLSAPAKKDFRRIIRYTKQEWGQDQAVNYKAKLDKQLQLISLTPRIGHQKPDIAEGILCVEVGRHLIFYEIEENTISVLRILHDSMDYTQHL